MLLLTLSALAGCGPVRHEIRPPANVGAHTIDTSPPVPPPPPPVPDDMRPFDRDWLYCIYPRALAVHDEFIDPPSYAHAVAFVPAPPLNPTPAPTDSPEPAPTPAPPVPPAPPAPPAGPADKPIARLLVLPGFPGDALDRNLNGLSPMKATMGDIYAQMFGGRKFSDFTATPLSPPPAGLSQCWQVQAVDPRGRTCGFIARSANLAAWSFALCEVADHNRELRDTLLSRLDIRLGRDLNFDDPSVDWRIDTDPPPGWQSPGPSPLSRRWDAPDNQGFLIITNGELRDDAVFRACTAADAAALLHRFPPLKDHPDAAMTATDSFLPALHAACGAAETSLDTAPRATTVGVWVFYDPVARKKFSVYYGYQSTACKQQLDRALARLRRVAIIP